MNPDNENVATPVIKLGAEVVHVDWERGTVVDPPEDFSGTVSPKASRPVIMTLQDLLAQARIGNVREIMVIYTMANGTTGHAFYVAADQTKILGEMSMATRTIQDLVIYESVRDHGSSDDEVQ